MQDAGRQQATNLFLRNYDLVKRLALRYAPERLLTDDIVNDVFLEFVNNADRWNLENDMSPLLIHLTRSVSARHWKNYYKNRPESLRQIAEAMQKKAEERTDSAMYDVEEEKHLEECIQKLGQKARNLLENHYWHKRSYVEIAKEQNVKIPALRQVMMRIRLKLRRCIESKNK